MLVIPLSSIPDERLDRLFAFADEVLEVCDEIGIEPLLDGSLAVRTHLQDAAIAVRDLDLNCSEVEFPRLQRALYEKQIFCEIQPWRVLQARRDGLKIEFSAMEFWMQGISGPYEVIMIGTHRVHIVGRDDLRELYQRGVDATRNDPEHVQKHMASIAKLAILDAACSQ